MEVDDNSHISDGETPCRVLSSFRPELTFSEIVSENSDTVTVMTKVDGSEFRGSGGDLPTAMEQVAAHIILYLCSTEEIAISVDRFNKLMSWKDPSHPAVATDQKQNNVTNSEFNHSSLMIFNQMYERKSRWCITRISVTPSLFRAELTVKEKTYEAEGVNKKAAKQAAAEAAIIGIHGVDSANLYKLIGKKKRGDTKPRAEKEKRILSPTEKKEEVYDEMTKLQECDETTPLRLPFNWWMKQKFKKPCDGVYRFPSAMCPIRIMNIMRRNVKIRRVWRDGGGVPYPEEKIVLRAFVDGTEFTEEGTDKQETKTALSRKVLQHFKDVGCLRLVNDQTYLEHQENNITATEKLQELVPDIEITTETVKQGKRKGNLSKISYLGKTYEGKAFTKNGSMHRASGNLLHQVFGLSQPYNRGSNNETDVTMNDAVVDLANEETKEESQSEAIKAETEECIPQPLEQQT